MTTNSTRYPKKITTPFTESSTVRFTYTLALNTAPIALNSSTASDKRPLIRSSIHTAKNYRIGTKKSDLNLRPIETSNARESPIPIAAETRHASSCWQYGSNVASLPSLSRCWKQLMRYARAKGKTRLFTKPAIPKMRDKPLPEDS